MNISAIFIKRPIATTLLMLAIVIFGVAGYLQLPVNDLPNVDYPTITVNAGLPGANPDTMAAAVALPLEKQLSTIPGVEQMTSNSGLGRSNITLQFDLSRDIDGAAQDVQAAITRVRMPRDMPSPPTWRKVNPADQSILTLLLSSKTLPLSVVDEYAQNNIAQRLSMISGVAQVDVGGSQKYAVRVRVDPYQLAARQIGLNEVQDTVASGNVNQPTGTIWGSQQTMALQTTGQLFSAADYAPLIVAYRNGASVRLSDVAEVIDSVENQRNSSWFNGERNIQISIVRQPGSNTVEVVDRIKEVLPATSGKPAAGNQHDRSLRPFGFHPGLRERRKIHLVAGAVPGDPGDLPISAEFFRHHHPQSGAAAFHRRHVCRDVSGGIFDQ